MFDYTNLESYLFYYLYQNLTAFHNVLIDFIDKAHDRGYKVGIAIDDYKKVDMFTSDKVSFYKILSKDVNNRDLFDSICKTSVENIYISTGMSDYNSLDDIVPQLTSMDNRIKLIHTQLSNTISDVNLSAIELMHNKYKVPIAYGHHCIDKNVIYASLGFSPESIFFYIKGDENLTYPDDLHAVSIGDVCSLVDSIRQVQVSIGDGNKVSMDNWA